MFLPGIGGHLKVSHMDPRVSFGNESTNLSVQKSFLPFYIKSSHPTHYVLLYSMHCPLCELIFRQSILSLHQAKEHRNRAPIVIEPNMKTKIEIQRERQKEFYLNIITVCCKGTGRDHCWKIRFLRQELIQFINLFTRYNLHSVDSINGSRAKMIVLQT